MHLAFDIFQGIGIAAAVGIRPFLPGIAVGALAAGNVEIHFEGTDYSFLQSWEFLLGLAIVMIVVALTERRLSRMFEERGLALLVIVAFSAALGALYFAGSLARGHYTAWPGLIGGVICAIIGVAATRPVFERARKRLDPEAASAVPLYAEGAGLVLAVLSVLAPPVGVIGLAFLIWLLIAGRRREGQKYAGLRILR